MPGSSPSSHWPPGNVSALQGGGGPSAHNLGQLSQTEPRPRSFPDTAPLWGAEPPGSHPSQTPAGSDPAGASDRLDSGQSATPTCGPPRPLPLLSPSAFALTWVPGPQCCLISPPASVTILPTSPRGSSGHLRPPRPFSSSSVKAWPCLFPWTSRGMGNSLLGR